MNRQRVSRVIVDVVVSDDEDIATTKAVKSQLGLESELESSKTEVIELSDSEFPPPILPPPLIEQEYPEKISRGDDEHEDEERNGIISGNESSNDNDDYDDDDSTKTTTTITTTPVLRKTTSNRLNIEHKPQIFADLPTKTEAALSTFTEIKECIYSGKSIGGSGQMENMTCDCREDWSGDSNLACGEDSDCINRLTSIECINDSCTCGDNCQNQRFQKHQYSPVDVIETEKKGYGLRALENISQGSFIYEYIGEIIDEPKFLKRMENYKIQGIKHFYFMMLQKGEFIDATMKGCLARFCNHSCLPNCYVDKWIVGDKVRMGIFSKRDILKGEEITFDYNVDRYGTQAQPCYCGEPNCVGILGGKTQTEAATNKLPALIVDALDLNRQDEKNWISIAAKYKKKNNTTQRLADGEPSPEAEDEQLYQEYSRSLPVKEVSESSVSKVISSLMQSREKWLIEKLVARINLTTDTDVHARVMRMHGYQVFSVILRDSWPDDAVPVMILEILTRWPRLTKNKISSSKIETTVQDLAQQSPFESVKTLAKTLLEEWSNLKMAYRIPRRERSSIKDDNGSIVTSASASETPPDNQDQSKQSDSTRRLGFRDRPAARPVSNGFGARYGNGRKTYDRTERSERSSREGSISDKLIPGWESSVAPNGRTYYFNRSLGITTWERPQPDPPKNAPSGPKDGRILPDTDLAAKEQFEKNQQKLILQNIIEQAKLQQQQYLLQQQQMKINELQSIVDAATKGMKNNGSSTSSGSRGSRGRNDGKSKEHKEHKEHKEARVNHNNKDHDQPDDKKEGEKNQLEKTLTNIVCNNVNLS